MGFPNDVAAYNRRRRLIRWGIAVGIASLSIPLLNIQIFLILLFMVLVIGEVMDFLVLRVIESRQSRGPALLLPGPSRNTADSGASDVDAPTEHDLSFETTDFFDRKVRILVDRASNAITFEHCHLSNAFWTLRASKHFTCRLTEVRDVFYVPGGGIDSRLRGKLPSETTIVTDFGRAKVVTDVDSPEAIELSYVRQALSPYCQYTPPAPFSQHPVFVLLVAFVLPIALIAAYLVYYVASL